MIKMQVDQVLEPSVQNSSVLIMLKNSIVIACLCTNILADEESELRLAAEFRGLVRPMDLIRLTVGPKQDGVPPGMEKMTDADRTRMIAAYLFHQNGQNPYSDHTVTALLNSFPDTIQDDTEFRRMLADERDARRFHLLMVNLSGRSIREGATLISETAHMLLRDAPVGSAGGDYQSPAFDDVSVGTYEHILTQLGRVGASFEAPPDDLPHEQRKLVLARWLKDNWPGCENLEIFEIERKRSEYSSGEPLEPRIRPEIRFKTTNEAEESISFFKSHQWLLIITAMTLSVIIIGFFKRRQA